MIIIEKYLKESLKLAIENSVWKKEGKPDKVRKFDESLDLIVNLKDIDIKNPNNKLDWEFLLPNPIHNDKLKICILGDKDIILEAKERNIDAYDTIYLEELNKKDNKAKKQFVKKYDVFICQSTIMKNVAKVLGRPLGQAGLMPKPQPKGYGIISPEAKIASFIDNFKKLVKIQTKKSPIIQTIFGKKSLDFDKNFENLIAVINFIESKLPNGNNNIESIYLKTTMGKPVKVKEPVEKSKGGRRKK